MSERECVLFALYHGNSNIVYITTNYTSKTITNQKIKLIKPTGTIMTEEVYKTLALPTLTCPMTAKRFRESDVIELDRAVSSFAASGNVEAKKYRPNFN